MVEFSSIYSQRPITQACDQLILVTARYPEDFLYEICLENRPQLQSTGIQSIDKIGDCDAPGTIAAAVYSGHLWGRQLGEPDSGQDVPFRREMVELLDT